LELGHENAWSSPSHLARRRNTLPYKGTSYRNTVELQEEADDG
jgi:hypothetical protein